MFLPSIFSENLLDDFFGTSYDMPKMRNISARQSIISTDVKELEKGYEISMDLPGYKKENVQAELKDGYLTVSAVTDTSNDTKDEEGRYIRRERYRGSVSRSFYVGEGLTQEDIKAKFQDGVLRIDVPKYEAKPEVEEKRYISIEG